jgi:hypothetical protein
MSAVLLIVLAGALALIGRWGRRNAHSLVLASLPGAEREHRIRVLRRGGLSCHVAAAALILIVVVNTVRGVW